MSSLGRGSSVASVMSYVRRPSVGSDGRSEAVDWSVVCLDVFGAGDSAAVFPSVGAVLSSSAVVLSAVTCVTVGEACVCLSLRSSVLGGSDVVAAAGKRSVVSMTSRSAAVAVAGTISISVVGIGSDSLWTVALVSGSVSSVGVSVVSVASVSVRAC